MRTRSIIALVLILLATAPLRVGAAPLAERIPADALVYIGWTGAESLGASYEQSHLKAVLDASAIPELFQTFLPELIERVGPKDAQAARVMQMIETIGAPMWRHPSAIYFGGIDWTGPQPTPRLAVMCDAGAEADRLAATVNQLLAKAPRNGPPVRVLRDGSLVIVAMGSPAMVQALSHPPADSLAKSTAFTAAFTQTHDQDSIAVSFVDAQGIVKAIDDGLQRSGEQNAVGMWSKIRDALGLSGMRQAIWSAGFDGKEWSEEGFVGTDGGTNGLLALFNAPPLSDDALAVVPQSATRVAAGHFDLATLVRQIRAGIEQFNPQTTQQFDDAINMVNAMAGIDIQKDLLDPLGDQWVFYTDRTVGGPGLLGMVLVNKPKDAARLDNALTTLAQHANQMIASAIGESGEVSVQFRESAADGITIHYLAVPLVSPAWAIKDGNLYFALYPQVINSAARWTGSHAPSITANPAFVATQKRLGNHKASSVTFSNLPETAGEGYVDVLAISRLYLGFSDMLGVPTPGMVLPPLDKLLPHVTPAGGASWTDNSGWHYKSISPFPGSEALADNGFGSLMIGQNAMLMSIMLPSLNRARETANRVKCASNERQIGQAILLYANENKQKYPDDLGTLIKTQDITPDAFICPTRDSSVPPEVAQMTPDQKAAWVNEHADYVYVGKGQTTSAPADRIIVYEKPDAHDGEGMNILYGDGHVEFVKTEEANRLIDKQEKRGENGL